MQQPPKMEESYHPAFQSTLADLSVRTVDLILISCTNITVVIIKNYITCFSLHYANLLT